jgi:hypothetical protein
MHSLGVAHRDTPMRFSGLFGKFYNMHIVFGVDTNLLYTYKVQDDNNKQPLWEIEKLKKDPEI